MNKNGPIVIIDDDNDEQYLMLEIFKRLEYKNEIIFVTIQPDINKF
jgi:hypothetical protein